jgi:mannose-1-phosphate guanylyltransferase
VKRISGRGEAADGLTPWHFSGVHIVEPRVVEAVPRSGSACINRDVYLALVARGERVHGHVVEGGYWSDLGTPARYLATQNDLMNGALDFARFPGVTPLSPASSTGIWRKLGWKARPPIRVQAPAWLGPKANLGEGAWVGPNASVNGSVAAGARLSDSALLEGEVTSGEVLKGVIRLGRYTTKAG